VVGRLELMDAIRPTGDPFLDYETRGLVGGTMSGNSIVTAAGHAVLAHLRRHPEIYDELDAKTAYLSSELSRRAVEREIPCHVAGVRSVASIRFGETVPSSTVREQQGGSHFNANIALAYHMRRRGVYLPEMHTMMIGAAHTYDDLRCVVDVFADSLDEMIADGLFVTD
jgi:glutamate-1-semialdehyde 2,1-aminomutase